MGGFWACSADPPSAGRKTRQAVYGYCMLQFYVENLVNTADQGPIPLWSFSFYHGDDDDD